MRTYGELTLELVTSSGVRQGFPLSQFLFNFVINMLSKIIFLSSVFPRVNLLPGDSLVNSEYSDDIVLFGNDSDTIESSDQPEHVWDAVLSL